MKQAQLEVLLGRSLTATEVTNLKTYLKITEEQLEDLTGSKFENVTESRTFNGVDNEILKTEPFTEINSISVDGDELDAEDYKVQQDDDRNADWFNMIVFDNQSCRDNDIVVDASWGFDCYPRDLQLLQAKLFDLNTKLQTSNSKITSKQIEDFRITLKDTTEWDQFKLDNAAVIAKYSVESNGGIRHGRVCSVSYY